MSGTTSIYPEEQALVFITCATTSREVSAVQLLIESIRSFGGRLGSSPIWVFRDPELGEDEYVAPEPGVDILPLTVPESIKDYYLSGKVFACAEAERAAGTTARSLVWLSPDTLVVNPPVLYALDDATDAAIRPVHIRNVGIPVDEPLDPFWTGVFRCAGLDDTTYSVESFVDGQRIRAYFNSHSYCVNPSVGLLRRWLQCYETLVLDSEFQDSACSDELHKIFLHQAVLSALTVAMITPERIRVLPPTYSYPYNLQESVPTQARVTEFSRLVSIVYEERLLHPDSFVGMIPGDRMRSWLCERLCERPE